MPCNIQIITKYMIVVETVMLNQLKITSAKNVCILQSNTSFCVSSCKDCIFVQSIYLLKDLLLETTQQKTKQKMFQYHDSNNRKGQTHLSQICTVIQHANLR